jgi:hypothetical protein
LRIYCRKPEDVWEVVAHPFFRAKKALSSLLDGPVFSSTVKNNWRAAYETRATINVRSSSAGWPLANSSTERSTESSKADAWSEQFSKA